MQKDKIGDIIKDIGDLAKYVSLFESVKKEDLSLNSIPLSSTCPLNANPLRTFEYKVVFTDGLKSFTLPSQSFTNKIKNRLETSNVNYAIRDILEYDDRTINIDDLPLKFDKNGMSCALLCESSDVKKRRYSIIFGKKGIHLDDYVMKADYIPNSLKDIATKRNGDLIRVYYRKDVAHNIFNILLLDVHHLIADKNYLELYKKVRGYGDCLTGCKEIPLLKTNK